MLQLVIGSIFLLLAIVAAATPAVDRFYDLLRPFYEPVEGASRYATSRRLAKFWVAPFLLILGVVAVTSGVADLR
jgi:hypothetical protein